MIGDQLTNAASRRFAGKFVNPHCKSPMGCTLSTALRSQIDMRQGFLSNPFTFFDMDPPVRAHRVGMTRKKPTFDDGTVPNAAERIQRVIDIVKLPKNTYEYSPLSPEEDFRVLILDHGKGDEPIRCDLVPCALSATKGGPQSLRTYEYEALSYYWGQDEARTPITIQSATSKQFRDERLGWENYSLGKYHIRPNLHAALLHLRLPDRKTVLWVDALCIDQENADEKTKQVSRMHEIYSEARNVCVWLGNPKSFDAKRTIEFMREIVLDLGTLDQLVVSTQAADQWMSLINLMKNRWFSRRWVVQELALAKDASVHCGHEVINWIDFKDAVALFGTKHDQIKKLLKSTRQSEMIGDMRALGANTLVDVTNNLFRRSDQGKILERLSSLEVLVSTLLAFEAKDPKDTIYAVLSIAKDTPYSYSDSTASAASTSSAPPDLRIAPDYTKSLSDICTDFIDYCIETSSSLDIICRHWAPKRKKKSDIEIIRSGPETEENLPSWIPSVTGSAFGDPETALRGRVNGDSFVGTPSRQNHQSYNGSGDLKPWVSFGRVPDGENLTSEKPERNECIAEVNEVTTSPSSSTTGHMRASTPRLEKKNRKSRFDGTLSVKGLRLAMISKLSQRAAEGMIFRECLEMGGWRDDDALESVPERLWRTLVADRGPNGTNAPSWYHRACMQCLSSVTPNGDLSPSALMALNSTPSTMVSFLERVQRVIWDRKFLRTEEGIENGKEKKSLFGLAPTRAMEGDIICILFGCSVPVVLREHITADDHYFEFIGESYIHGMMDGEAVAKKRPEWPYSDSETFKLR